VTMTSHRTAAAASAAAAAAAAVDGRRVGDKCASGVRDEPLTHTLHVVLHDCSQPLRPTHCIDHFTFPLNFSSKPRFVFNFDFKLKF